MVVNAKIENVLIGPVVIFFLFTILSSRGQEFNLSASVSTYLNYWHNLLQIVMRGKGVAIPQSSEVRW